MSRLSLRFAWFDLWVGVYVAPDAIYVCPLPMILVKWRRAGSTDKEGTPK